MIPTDDRRIRTGMGRSLLAGLFWWVLLAGVYMLYVGEWDSVDLMGAGATGLIAGGMTALLVRQGMFRLRGEFRWLKEFPAVVIQIVSDFGFVTVRLLRLVVSGRRGDGVFVAREFRAGDDSAAGQSWRAHITVVSTFSPNSYVVDIDVGSGVRLSHDLVAHRASERPA
jgi:hypothetical protein